VDVEKNEDLFAPDYTEIHYTKTGTAQTICLNKTDNCFYHGRVRAIHESSVVLSTCRGLRGLIVISNNLSYILEPLPDSQEHHFIYRSEHLKVPHGSCGSEHLESKVTDWLAELTGRTEPRYHRVKRDDQQSMKYVELLLVADYAEFQKNKHDLQATKNKLVEAANYVDKVRPDICFTGKPVIF
uniref:ADAM metallopeptidase domain 19 n=1 Tax=Naja naja TaxID=35670 RepID=A0A8C6XBB9_NAJNA